MKFCTVESQASNLLHGGQTYDYEYELAGHALRRKVDRPRYEIADVLARYGEAYKARYGVSAHQWRVLQDLQECRTAALGAHQRKCAKCGYREISYNSCRDRHCPKCQGAETAAWTAARLEELLACPYFHVVFTLTDWLHRLCRFNERVLYGIFFAAAAETLRVFGADERYVGGEIGFIGILHTWGQTLNYHPHLHFLVTAGGLGADGAWRAPKYATKFLFPVRALSAVMRGKFLGKLERAYAAGQLKFPGELAQWEAPAGFQALKRRVARTAFYVYAKPPLEAVERVVEYLARYTHRVAIGNRRLVDVSARGVRFKYKDNQAGGVAKEMQLSGVEFIRRFVQHILPARFKRVRHYGLYSNTARHAGRLAAAQALLAGAVVRAAPVAEARSAKKVTERWKAVCPACGEGELRQVAAVYPWQTQRYARWLAIGDKIFDDTT